MGRAHDNDRAFVYCIACERPLPARLIETEDGSYWQPIGVPDRGCPDCGGTEYEELDPP